MVQSSKSKVGRCSIFALFSHKRESAVEGCTDFAYLGNRPNAYNCCMQMFGAITLNIHVGNSNIMTKNKKIIQLAV